MHDLALSPIPYISVGRHTSKKMIHTSRYRSFEEGALVLYHFQEVTAREKLNIELTQVGNNRVLLEICIHFTVQKPSQNILALKADYLKA